MPELAVSTLSSFLEYIREARLLTGNVFNRLGFQEISQALNDLVDSVFEKHFEPGLLSMALHLEPL